MTAKNAFALLSVAWLLADVMRGWMGSQGHRENLLAPATTHIGTGRQGDWWVQNFGTGGVC